jgi:hypothetical protein
VSTAAPARCDRRRSDALPARGRGRAFMGDRRSRTRVFRPRARLRRGGLGTECCRRADRPPRVALELASFATPTKDERERKARRPAVALDDRRQ